MNISSVSEKRISLCVMVPLGTLLGLAGIGAAIAGLTFSGCIYGSGAMGIAAYLAAVKFKAHRDQAVFERIYTQRASRMRTKLARMLTAGVAIASTAFLFESLQSDSPILIRIIGCTGGLLIAAIGSVYVRFLTTALTPLPSVLTVPNAPGTVNPALEKHVEPFVGLSTVRRRLVDERELTGHEIPSR